MSFQSIPGWNSQKLLIKICHNCLLKRPVLTPVRGYTVSLDVFRKELYQKPSPLKSYSPIVQKTILRRETRKRLLDSYRLIKQQQPQLLSLLTQQDLDCFLARFMTNPNDPQSNSPLFDLFQIYKDLKYGALFPQYQFRRKDLENMIYVATELGLVDMAESLLREDSQVSVESYEAVIRLLSKHQMLDKIQAWLQHVPITRDMVQSVVMCYLDLEKLTEAADFLRQHHPGKDLTQVVLKHTLEDRELLDHALNIFSMDCVRQWRLNDMRFIYCQKRQLGFSTTLVVRNLLEKSLHTGQTHTAEKLLLDTLRLKDMASIQLCAKRLIHWYLSKTNITHAVKVWDRLEAKDIRLPAAVMDNMMTEAARLRYHVDTIRLYNRCKELLYPVQDETKIRILKCLVRSKQFKLANQMSPEIEELIPKLNKRLTKMAMRTLFALSSQTGNLKLFERTFEKCEKDKLELRHIGLTSLIACYLTRNDVKSAKEAFQNMSEYTTGPDVVDFNLLIRTVAMEDKELMKDKVLEILKHMKLVNVEPNETTFRTMLNIYDDESDIRKNLIDRLWDDKTRFNQVFLNNILLTRLLETKNVGYVTSVLLNNDRSKLYPTKANGPILCDGLTFKILIDAALSDVKNANIVEKLFTSMRTRGMKPEKEVYEKLIGILARRGKIQKARRYMKKMEEEVGIQPDRAVYMKLVDGLIALNKPTLALEIIENEMNEKDEEVEKKIKKIRKMLE